MTQAARIYPTPRELGLVVPSDLREDRFTAGFRHALDGRHLDRAEYFRRSFRLGFRAAKLFLREVRRRQGIREFPLRGRVRLRAIFPH